MKSNEAISHADAARDHLVTSLRELASDHDQGCSKYLWLAAREASIFAAHKQGWDVDTDDEIAAAIRRIDEARGEAGNIEAQFDTAKMFRENATHGWMEKDDVIWFQPTVHRFVNQMLALDTPPRSKPDANHG